jgi:hypothetical protein
MNQQQNSDENPKHYSAESGATEMATSDEKSKLPS